MIISFDKNSTSAVRSWLRRNGFNCGCGIGHSFCYSPDTHRIEVPKTYKTNILDTYLIEYLSDKGMKCENIEALTITILHEVGHSETIRLFSEKEFQKDMEEKFRIETKLTEKNLKESNYKYWKLPTENMANNWAINYINTFPQKVERLTKILYRNCKIVGE